jgi:hypothetical protein
MPPLENYGYQSREQTPSPEESAGDRFMQEAMEIFGCAFAEKNQTTTTPLDTAHSAFENHIQSKDHVQSGKDFLRYIADGNFPLFHQHILQNADSLAANAGALKEGARHLGLELGIHQDDGKPLTITLSRPDGPTMAFTLDNGILKTEAWDNNKSGKQARAYTEEEFPQLWNSLTSRDTVHVRLDKLADSVFACLRRGELPKEMLRDAYTNALNGDFGKDGLRLLTDKLSNRLSAVQYKISFDESHNQIKLWHTGSGATQYIKLKR